MPLVLRARVWWKKEIPIVSNCLKETVENQRASEEKLSQEGTVFQHCNGDFQQLLRLSKSWCSFAGGLSKKCVKKSVQKMCPQHVSTTSVHKRCPQKVSTKSVHKKFLQKVSTKSVHKKWPQNVTMRSVRKKCPQKLSTKSVKKKCSQKVCTNGVQKKCPQKVSTKIVHKK